MGLVTVEGERYAEALAWVMIAAGLLLLLLTWSGATIEVS
jgi:hypothetical protein